MSNIKHTRWSITQCPCFPAEMTVWWFLSGSKEWCSAKARKYVRDWR